MFCLVSFCLFVFSFSSGEVLLGLSRVLCPAFIVLFSFFTDSIRILVSLVFFPHF